MNNYGEAAAVFDSRIVRARALPCLSLRHGDPLTDSEHREATLSHASRAREQHFAVAHKKGRW